MKRTPRIFGLTGLIGLIGLIGLMGLSPNNAAARPWDPSTDTRIFTGSGGEYSTFKTTRGDCPDGYIFEDRSFHEGRRKVRNNWCTTHRWYHDGHSTFHPGLGIFGL
jgi:hypothetical protein